MAINKLPRLLINWLSQPETFRRYWDQFATEIEKLKSSFETVAASPVAVSDLSSVTGYNRAIVSDATTKVFGDIVVGGGSEKVPVYFDGTDWRIG